MTAIHLKSGARFKPGDAVRIGDRDALGHCRTPWYLRGKTGVIGEILGTFRDPARLAYHKPGYPAQVLYKVRLRANRVVARLCGSANRQPRSRHLRALARTPDRDECRMSHDHEHDHEHDHDHDHDHAHDHGHAPPQPDHDAGPMSGYELLEEALRSLLIEKKLLSEAEIAAQIDTMDSRSPALGAKVVARAWTDPAFKQRLMTDCRTALKADMAIDIGQVADFKVVENTAQTHNVVVCTLCSCYPKMLLGIPPAWYKSLSYRSRTVVDPRGVLREFGLNVPVDQKVKVHNSTADLRYIVLPVRPAGTENWSEERLANLVTRDCMIGTATPLMPV